MTGLNVGSLHLQRVLKVVLWEISVLHLSASFYFYSYCFMDTSKTWIYSPGKAVLQEQHCLLEPWRPHPPLQRQPLSTSSQPPTVYIHIKMDICSWIYFPIAILWDHAKYNVFNLFSHWPVCFGDLFAACMEVKFIFLKAALYSIIWISMFP